MDFEDRLSQLEGIVWDLDNTLYRLDADMARMFHRAVARAAIEGGADLEMDQAVGIARQSFIQNGFSGAVFVREYKIDEVWLHHKFHDYIDETEIKADSRLPDLFARLPLRHALITHGSAEWARRVLKHIGLKDYFDPSCVLGLEDYGFSRKSKSVAPFALAMDRLGIAPDPLLFVEDTAKNLPIAYDFGIGTVLLQHGVQSAERPPWVDATYDGAADLLHHVLTVRA